MVEAHLLASHRGCPASIADEIVRRVVDRDWSPPVPVGKAIGRVATSLIRHRLTDYDRLFEVEGLTRDEARMIVATEVEAILLSWKEG